MPLPTPRRFPYTTLFRSPHEALSEMVLPDAIDGHARGQRVVGARDPFSQLAAAIPRIEVRVARQDLRQPRLNLFALGPPIAVLDRKSTRMNSSHLGRSYAAAYTSPLSLHDAIPISSRGPFRNGIARCD